jgi:putative NIF3 family GTP cyclohydrolase 1 type 2
VNSLSNENQDVGSGMIGNLKEPMSGIDFLHHLKESMELSCIRHTHLLDRVVKKVAVCGGAGSFLLKSAILQQADVFISSDFKYHEFFDAEGNITIADIGHYESEVFTKELLDEALTKKFPKFAVHLSEIVTNPINYF